MRYLRIVKKFITLLSNFDLFLATYVTPAPPTANIAIDSPPAPARPLSASIRLCPNATWDLNYSNITVTNFSAATNDTAFVTPADFFIDQNNIIYPSNGQNRIQKIDLANRVVTTVAKTTPFRPMSLYVDGAGTIYSCEEAVCYFFMRNVRLEYKY